MSRHYKSKISSFWSVVFFFSMRQRRTISQSDCDLWWKVDFIWQPVITSSVVGPRRSSRALPKAKFALKISRSLFGGMLSVWSTTAFWIQEKPLPLRSISANQWDALKSATPSASIGQQTGPSSSPQQRPTTCHIMNASKVEQIGLWSFASSAIFTWPLTN